MAVDERSASSLVNEEIASLRHKISILEDRDDTNISVIKSLRDENMRLRERIKEMLLADGRVSEAKKL